ncbi:hypothetical protein, partial [Vibrio cholerae]|uniref:hypothetical protein n=1 Tax=Vibrio cholerae TaxID=666 RepID=UPI000A252651
MFIDKFYRLYNPYTKVGEPRSSTDPTLHFKDEGWDALSYKITNVSDGNDFQDVSTVGQTLMRKGDVFVQGKRKFDFLELDSSGKWDGKKRKIKNVEKGEDPRDVAIVEQTLVRKDEGFVQGENKYEFLESQNNNWDAKNKKIIRAAKAEQPNEVPTLEQVLTS